MSENKCIRTFRAGDAVELLYFDMWNPAKIEKVNSEEGRITYDVSHPDLTSFDGSKKLPSGTFFGLGPEKLREPERQYRVGESVEFRQLDGWHAAKIERVDATDGLANYYEVSHGNMQSPDGTIEVLAGTHPFVMSSELRPPHDVAGEVGFYVPGFPGFDRTEEQTARFNNALTRYKDLPRPELVQFQPGAAEDFSWCDDYVTSWKWRRADPSTLSAFEARVQKLRELYFKWYDVKVGEANAHFGHDVGWWPGFGPSDDAKAVFAAASSRLDELLTWGVKEKLRDRAPTLEYVQRYREDWNRGKAELSHLMGFKSDILSLETQAAEKGFAKKAGEIPRIDVESVSAGTQAAASVAAAQKDLGAFAHDAMVETRTTLASGIFGMLDAIPAAYKIGAGVGVFGLAAVYAASAGKRR